MKRTVEAEDYFTPASIAHECCAMVDRHFGLDSFDVVVEPSAGAGAFFTLLPATTRIGLDIDPKHPDLEFADFLQWLPPRTDQRILTIGNPPFGQRGAMAVQFIQHACVFSDVVAFILPRSFRKYTFQNRVPLDFHLIDSLECDEFIRADGSQALVRAVFQVWERRDVARVVSAPPDSHQHFEMRHAHLSRVSPTELARLRREFDFTIPQVGSNFAPRPVDAVTRGSHWFIRAKDPEVRTRFESLDFGFLDGMNTAHKSLSKRDIVAAYVMHSGIPADAATGTESLDQPTLW